MTAPVIVVQTPGLHRRTGLWAQCFGLFRPVVMVDPMVSGQPGERALVAHEYCHGLERHRLSQVVSMALATVFTLIGAWMLWRNDTETWQQITGLITALVCAAMNLAAFAVSRRESEIRADAWAIRETSKKEFISFLYMHPAPKGRWGKWVYGATVFDRADRAIKRLEREARGEG